MHLSHFCFTDTNLASRNVEVICPGRTKALPFGSLSLLQPQEFPPPTELLKHFFPSLSLPRQEAAYLFLR